MIWVQNQLVGAHEGQKLTLECYSEAFPKSINYWTRDQDKIVPQGERLSPINNDSALDKDVNQDATWFVAR